MAAFLKSIESTALPREDAVLRAIFSQITAEIRKKGLVLNEEDGSFYCSKRFSWKSTVKEFFDAYHKICERKQVHPIYQESKLTTALKVPYASIDTINLFHGGVVKRLMQFKESRVPPFSKLPNNPSTDDLTAIRKQSSGDKDICRFIDLVLVIDEELREYVSQLDQLAAAYMLRVSAYSMAVRGAGKEDAIKKKYDDSKRTIERILAPYISKLKRIGAIPSSWQYSFKSLPLTDEGKGYLAIMAKLPGSMSYWDNDILPLKSIIEADVKKRNKEREKAEKEAAKRRKREERERRKKAGKVRRPSHGFELSRPSLWYRFDKWVSGVGDWFGDKMHDVSDWMMQAWIWFLAAYVIIGLIVVWVNEGFFAALLGGIVIFFIVGVLASILEFIVALITLIVKYITCIPFFILRCIFYRGWTLVLSLLCGCGYLTYLILKAKFII